MSADRISVVVAVYNGEKFLAEQLGSILNQTHRDLEVIVADDASSDSSSRIAQAYAARDNRVRVIRNEKNLGLVCNFLNGLASATGAYAAFSDQDDVWNPEKLEVLLKRLRSRPENRLVYSDMDVCDSTLAPTGGSFWQSARVRPRRGSFFESAVLRNVVPGCAMLFTRAVADRLTAAAADPEFRRHHETCRLPDAWFMHDHLAFVAAMLDGEVDFVSRRLAKYRQHGANAVGTAGLPSPQRSVAAARIERQAEFLARLGWEPKPGSLARLVRFAGALRGDARLATRLSLADLYLAAKADTFSDKLLAAAECASPAGYDRIRSARRAPKGG